MKFYNYNINGFDLHVIKTVRFKTVFYSVNIRFDDAKEYEKYTSLLSRVLAQTSSKFDSVREINAFCASIYDPSYNIRVLESGSQDILSLTASFSNEKYTENGMNKKSFEFLSEVLFEPKVINGGFDEDVFKVQKEKLLEYYKTLRDRPQNYAGSRLSEEMQIKKYKTYKLDELIKEIEKLTSKELYEFYKKVMNEGKLDIFVCGDVEPDDVCDVLKKIIKFKGSRYGEINHYVKQITYNEEPNVIIEPSSNAQSNLIVGCKLLDLNDFERKYVFVLYSWILGGGMNSLLTQTVREKNSLCYYIYAVRQNLFDTMKIYAGIDGEDFEKTYELIRKEMDNMKKGNFSSELFEGVKEIYYNSLIKIEDSQSDLVGSFTSELFVHNDNIENRRKQMEKVTKEDVMNLAKKVHIDTVFLLKGER